MDFMNRLVDEVNAIDGIPIQCDLGYLATGESFVLYPLPGGRVIKEYYDGAKEQQLNFEFTMKSAKQKKINETLWLVQNSLEELSELLSQDGSFDFGEIVITNKPFINHLDEKNVYIFMLDIQAKITTY